MKGLYSLSRRISWVVLMSGLSVIVMRPQVSAQSTSGAILALNGHPIDPFQVAKGKIVVLIFVRTDCPISNRYAPTIQELSARYKTRAIVFLVYPVKSETQEQIQNHLNEFGYHLRAIRDPESVLVRESKVTVTPESAVFTQDRRLIYHGRIDDWYQDFGKARQAPTTHELSDAIGAAIAGKTPAQANMPAVGCYLPEKP